MKRAWPTLLADVLQVLQNSDVPTTLDFDMQGIPAIVTYSIQAEGRDRYMRMMQRSREFLYI